LSCSSTGKTFAIDAQSYFTVVALIGVTLDETVLGKARCRFFMSLTIPAIGPYELAVVDTTDKLAEYHER
jgi:hypothetical protein